MRIKEDLPQFKDGHALLLVSGDQSGIIYHAFKGEIDKIAEFKERTVPKDKEGFFGRRIKNGIMGVGATDENSEEKAQEKFVKEYSDAAKHEALSLGVSEVYLFSPPYFERTLFESLDDSLKKMTVLGVHGMFIKEHPFTILKKIKDSYTTAEPATEPSKEAKKLLTKNGEEYAPSALSHAKVERVRAFMSRKKK